jgi:two-component system OmpR family sensor kinase
MLRSLRATLLIWYTFVLVILIVVFAGTVTYQYWQSLIQQVDTDLVNATTALASGLTPDIDGTFDLNVPASFRSAVPESGDATYYAVWNPRGQLVDQSEPQATPPSMPGLGVATRLGRREVVVDVEGRARILAGRRLDSTYAAVRTLGLGLASSGGLVLALALIGGFFLAGRALAPVARISRTAGAMIGGDLEARIPVKGTASELEQVARALNEAFDRLSVAVDRQRQFTADASHELRTPLATLRAEFDWALTRPRTADEYKASIEKGQRAVERMSELADRLLTLVSPGGGPDMGRAPLNLATVVSASVELLRPLAVSHSVTLDTAYEDAPVSGVRNLLADAISNLLKNAIEYNRPGGTVSVIMTSEPDWVVTTIRDTGIGISAEDLPRVFERFYRADRSRTRGGAGLGLAIVKSVIEDHGGSVACSSTLATGTTFQVRLPRA